MLLLMMTYPGPRALLFSLISLCIGNPISAQWIYSQGLEAVTGLPELQRIHLTTYDFVRLTAMEDMGDIAFHPDGTLYGVVFDKVYELDSLSPASMEVFDIGDFQAVGMTIDHQGKMYFGGTNPATNRFGVAIFDPLSSQTRIVADFGPINSGFVNDLEFYNGDLYLVGQLPPSFAAPAVLYRVDTTGANMHDTITTYVQWPGRALAAISDSCSSSFLVSPATSVLNFFVPPLDSVRAVDMFPPDGLFYSSGAASRTAYLGSIPPLQITSIEVTDQPCSPYASITISSKAGRQTTIFYSLDAISYQSSALFQQVPPGTFRAYLRDTWGCLFVSEPFVVTDNDAHDFSISTTPAACGRDDGTIVITTPDPNLQFAVDNNIFTSTLTYSGLSVDVHFLYSRDLGGCIDTTPVSIVGIPIPSFDIIVQGEECNEADGRIELIDIAARPPFQVSIDSILWQSNPLFDQLETGSYTVHLRDSAGCVVSRTIQIIETSLPVFTEISIVNAHCGMDDGTITVTATSDRSPLEYLLNNQVSPLNVFSGMSPGIYLLSVRDTFGCKADTQIVMNSIGGPVITEINASVERCDLADATLTISAQPINTNLQYSIDGINWSQAPLFENLAAGIFQVFVRDENNCIASASDTIQEILAVQITSLVPGNAMCGQNNGTILVISELTEINGYSLDGIDFQTSPSFVDLAQGTYTIYLLSHDVCVDSAEVNVQSIPPPVIDQLHLDHPHCADDTGSVSIETSGGQGILLFTIEPRMISSMLPLVTGLYPGLYFLIAKDEAGCADTVSFSLIPGTGPMIEQILVIPSDCNAPTGSFRIEADGSGLTYRLENGEQNADGIFSGLYAGMYGAEIVDDHHCSLDTLISVPQKECPIYVPNVFSPNGDQINDYFSPVVQGQVLINTFEVFDRWGTKIFSCSQSPECTWDGRINGKYAASGVYLWRLVHTTPSGTSTQAGTVTVVR